MREHYRRLGQVPQPQQAQEFVVERWPRPRRRNQAIAPFAHPLRGVAAGNARKTAGAAERRLVRSLRPCGDFVLASSCKVPQNP